MKNCKFDRIYIEITNKCNFDCPFCSSCKASPAELSTKQFLEIASAAKEFTNEVCLHVLGEPLLFPRLEEVLQICATLDLKVNLVTNGFFVADKLTAILKYKDVFSKINFSLHSYIYKPEFMEAKFLEIISAASVLADNGILIELRNLANNCDQQFKTLLNKATEKVLQTCISNIYANQKLKGWLYYVVKKPFEWPDKTSTNHANKLKSNKVYCMAGRTHIAILSNLDVVPCCLDCGSSLLLGNLKEQTLSDILSGERFNNLYNSFSRGEANETFCQTCTYNNSIKNRSL